MYCLYYHISADKGDVFYIGIGNYKRPNQTYSRNRYWKFYVAKHGFYSNIILTDLSWKDACSWEKYLISVYGKKISGSGVLVNITDGGDGVVGLKQSEFCKRRSSETNKGKPKSSKTKELIGNAHRGKIVSDYTRKKLSDIKKGKKNPKVAEASRLRTGELSGRSRKVVDTLDGSVYVSAKEAAKAKGISYANLIYYLRALSNKTTLRYLDTYIKCQTQRNY